jgi:hypothetical protein
MRLGGQLLDYASFLVVMRVSMALRMAFPIMALCLCVQGQNPPSPPGKEAPIEAKGLPPRATPADYQSQAHAGTVTIAAEFTGHSIPTPQGPLTTEDYVAIETGLFGSPGARLQLSTGDFALRINGKKTPLPSLPYGMVIASVKDPEYVPAEAVASKSKSSLNTGGGGEQRDLNAPPPPPPPIPIGVQRAMAQRVQRAALPEGDRALPQAGVIFFQYRGKIQGIHSIELLYTGPAGKATLTLQP